MNKKTKENKHAKLALYIVLCCPSLSSLCSLHRYAGKYNNNLKNSQSEASTPMFQTAQKSLHGRTLSQVYLDRVLVSLAV